MDDTKRDRRPAEDMEFADEARMLIEDVWTDPNGELLLTYEHGWHLITSGGEPERMPQEQVYAIVTRWLTSRFKRVDTFDIANVVACVAAETTEVDGVPNDSPCHRQPQRPQTAN